MLVFFKRIGIFSLVLLISLWLLKKTVPHDWGNELVAHKLEYLEKNLDQYNTLFVGSSHMYRQLDVEKFDELTGNKSYNLGNSGMFGLEANFIVEKFLERNQLNRPFNIFVQKSLPTRIAKKNLHTNRGKYYMDLHRFRIGLTHFWNRGEWIQVYYHLVTYLENQLAIGQIREIIDYHTGTKKTFHEAVNESDGYYPLDKQLVLEPESRLIKRRHKKYVSSKAYKENTPVSVRDKKMKLEEISSGMLYLRTSQDSIRYFRFSTIKLDPKMYFDRGHMNSEGARLNTEILARQYITKYQ